jgi:thioredoxin reductase (NADPH)
MNNYDTIIIGAGPAGISCAIYLKRYGLNPLVIGNNQTVLHDAHQIENYYGIKSISGTDLYNEGINQAKALDTEVIDDEAIDIVFDTPYIVETKSNRYSAKTVVLALGSPKNKNAKAKKFEGEGVSYCAVCDGFFYRKKKTGLVGSGDYMLHELEILKQMIPDLTVFTNGVHVESSLLDDVKVVEDKIISFNGEEHLESITTSKDTYEIYGCFIAEGAQSSFTFAKHLGIGLDGNNIIVDKNMMTNIPGIFAAGDCIGGLKQVVKAASDGAITANSINKYLKTLA